MKVAFRTDASLDIGTGHVMRCLTLATALRERGAECLFICRAHPGNLLKLIKERGFRADGLSEGSSCDQLDDISIFAKPSHAVFLGVEWQTDAEETIESLNGQQLDWLVIDHYAIDARWERSLRAACRNIAVIDDLADRSHDCDLLIDQNLGRTTADYDRLLGEHCERLIGPRYALLRPEFAALREYTLARRRKAPELKRLLITMGGVDKDNATGGVLDALKGCPLPEDCRISIVLGPQAPWVEVVRQRAVILPWRTEVLVDVADMARLMAESDLAIGAAGATAWERCCLGLPSIVLVLADNQSSGAAALRKAGAAILLRDTKSIMRELPAAVLHLMNLANSRAMRIACSNVADGLGTNQVVEKLLS